MQDECLAMGFAFNPSCEQSAFDYEKRTQGYKERGESLCELLQQALHEREDIEVLVTAFLNDATGSLLSCSLGKPRCPACLFVGTGYNNNCVEGLKRVKPWKGETTNTQTVLVNTGWRAFGENKELDFILTKWDHAVDSTSVNPGELIYEKMISGSYLGEVVRHVLLELVEEKLVFAGTDASKLSTKGAFQTRHACEVELDSVGSVCRSRKVVQEVLGHDKNVTIQDCHTVKYVCQEVSKRASMMLASGIAGLLRKMDCKDIVVTVDDTLFKYHPLFYSMTKKNLSQLMGIECKFDLLQCEDVSGFGAAIVATVMSNDLRTDKIST